MTKYLSKTTKNNGKMNRFTKPTFKDLDFPYFL